MPPDETTITEQTPDDVFAAAFAQLSEADAKTNAPAPLPEPNANAQPQRTEADRATSEAQRDSAAFAPTGPTGPSAAGGGTTEAALSPGTTGPSGATGGTGEELPPDDKAKAAEAAAAARAAAEASLQHQQPKADPIERLADLITQRQTTEDPRRQRQEPPPDPLAMFSPDEKKFLADYEKEYPDIARAEFMRRRIEYAQLTSWMFQQINEALAPKFEQLDMIATRTHAGDLQQQVPVYNNEVRDKVIDWATKQPMYKRVAYEHVIKQGTVDEVADLISTFQKETGYAPPKPQAQAQAQTQAPDPAAAAQAAQEAAKAAAAAKLAPVRSTNAQRAISAVAPQDFDGAFDWATRALANI
jgi:hypothetical protein